MLGGVKLERKAIALMAQMHDKKKRRRNRNRHGLNDAKEI